MARPTGRLDQLGGIVEPLTTVALSVVFTFFVLLQREDLRNRLIRLTGDRHVTVTTQAMNDATRRISRYFSLQLLINLIYGCLIRAALYLIGLPHSLLFGSLAALFREVLATISAENPDVVFLSGMPPFAMARAHRLYRSLRTQNQRRKIMIGIWNYPDDVSRAAQKMCRGDEIPIATTLAGALAQVRSYFGRTAEPSLALAEETSAL